MEALNHTFVSARTDGTIDILIDVYGSISSCRTGCVSDGVSDYLISPNTILFFDHVTQQYGIRGEMMSKSQNKIIHRVVHVFGFSRLYIPVGPKPCTSGLVFII